MMSNNGSGLGFDVDSGSSVAAPIASSNIGFQVPFFNQLIYVCMFFFNLNCCDCGFSLFIIFLNVFSYAVIEKAWVERRNWTWCFRAGIIYIHYLFAAYTHCLCFLIVN